MDRVRVKHPENRAEFTTDADWAAMNGLSVIDKPAVNTVGDDLPPKYPITTKRGATAAPEKE